MYIELFGPERQPESVWDKVRIKVRHLGRAFFRAGDGQIKQYHQPITTFRDLKFDRFKISDEDECRERKEDPDRSGKYVLMLTITPDHRRQYFPTAY